MTRKQSGFLNTLSGRFLILTVGFVMLTEVLIFVPSKTQAKTLSPSREKLLSEIMTAVLTWVSVRSAQLHAVEALYGRSVDPKRVRYCQPAC